MYLLSIMCDLSILLISGLISLQFGPANPFRSQQMAAPRNMLSGFAEPAHVNDFMFEQQRRTFSTFGERWTSLSAFTCDYNEILTILRLIFVNRSISGVLKVYIQRSESELSSTSKGPK